MNKIWFAPKSETNPFGPVSWEGWAAILLFVAAVVAANIWLANPARLIAIGIGVVALLAVRHLTLDRQE